MAFVVLSLPILAVLLIVVVAIIAIRVAERRAGTTAKKWITGFIVALVAVLILTWDEVGGRLYLSYLCATQGGAVVYKQVKLPTEYWSADGSPIFLDDRGNKVRTSLDDTYQFTSESTDDFSKVFRITRLIYRVQDRNTREVFGTYTIFFSFGGWFQNFTSLNIIGRNCPDDRGFYPRFLRKIFIH